MPDAPTLTPWDPRRGAASLDAALGEWALGVREPPIGSGDRIRAYLRAAGFTRANWYEADGDAKWCGAFAAWCLGQAGARAELLIQKTPPELGGLGSTYRAWCLVNIDQRRHIMRAEDVRPGDVIIVGRLGRARWGEHIAIASGSAHDGRFATVEGNAAGKLGDGDTGEGVVIRSRAVAPGDRVKGFIFGVRLTPDDFTQEA